MADERVMRHIGKGPMSREEVAALIEPIERRWRDIGMGWWTIREKRDGRVIGQLCLQPLEEAISGGSCSGGAMRGRGKLRSWITIEGHAAWPRNVPLFIPARSCARNSFVP
jgi:RimJ/RimL family protein N-acetyltransferase